MALIVILIEFLLDDYIRDGEDLEFHTLIYFCRGLSSYAQSKSRTITEIFAQNPYMEI